ncbi:MAG TPA: hypothetical protein VHL32_11140 [Gemmatimonadaceae bacterium]|nr:hypothetical protein [Gemmatimonadaceae bacterium]
MRANNEARRRAPFPPPFPKRASATLLAEFVRQDFRELIAIFDRQLENGAGGDSQIASPVREARAAAQCGLDLAEQLVRLLGSVH